MSETQRSPEVAPATELIAYGLKEWLKKEVGSSAVGRNSYLDDFKDFRSSLILPYADYRNTNAAKNRSHYNRLEEWTDAFDEQYAELDSQQKDYAVARQIFAAQMYLSGLFRVQCMMQAANQEDYYHRRLDENFIGIDLLTTTQDRLEGLFGDVPEADEFENPRLGMAELMYQTREMNRKQFQHSADLHQTGRYSMSRESSPIINRIMKLQRGWANLVVNYVAFTAAECDGQLAAVPFLEPKSISDDPQIYYPFAA